MKSSLMEIFSLMICLALSVFLVSAAPVGAKNAEAISVSAGGGSFSEYDGSATRIGVTYQLPVKKLKFMGGSLFPELDYGYGKSDRATFHTPGVYGVYKYSFDESPLYIAGRAGLVYTDLEVDNLTGSGNTWEGDGFDAAGGLKVGYELKSKDSVALHYRLQGSPDVESGSTTSKPGDFSEIMVSYTKLF